MEWRRDKLEFHRAETRSFFGGCFVQSWKTNGEIALVETNWKLDLELPHSSAESFGGKGKRQAACYGLSLSVLISTGAQLVAMVVQMIRLSCCFQELKEVNGSSETRNLRS